MSEQTLNVRVEWEVSGVSILTVPDHLILLALAAVGPDEEPDQEIFESLPEYREWLADQLTAGKLQDVVDDFSERDVPVLLDTEQEGGIDQRFFDADTARREEER